MINNDNVNILMINTKLVSDILSYLCISVFKLKVKTYDNSCQFTKKNYKNFKHVSFY